MLRIRVCAWLVVTVLTTDLCQTCKGVGFLEVQTSLFPGEPDQTDCPDCDGVNRARVHAPDSTDPWEPIPVPGAPVHGCSGMTCQVCHRTAAQEAKQAIAAVDLNAADEWKRTAAYVVARFADDGRQFTTDDVMLELEQTSVRTHDARALGPVMQRAIRSGLIAEVGMTKSRRRHGARIPVYAGAALARALEAS